MTEILTESFCERCGTRYTFETTQPKGRSLGALGTLGRGLRLFVTSSESSFDESLAEARSEAEQRVTAAQLEAFHRTFNFCLSCRQYTCADCWNAVEGRCLTCSPLPEAEVRPLGSISIAAAGAIAEAPAVGLAPPTAVEPLIVPSPGEALAGGLDAGPDITAAAIVEASAPAPVSDLEPPPDLEPAPRAFEPEAEAEVPPSFEVAPEAVAAVEAVEDVPVAVPAPAEPQVAPEVAAEGETVEVAAEEPAPETELAEVAEYEPETVAPEPEAVAPEPEAVAPEPEPEVAVAEPAAVPPEPEPVAVQPEPPSAPAEPAPPAPVAGKVALPEFLPGRSLDEEIAAYELRVAALADAPSEPLPHVVIEATRPAPGPSMFAEVEPPSLPMTPPESVPTPAVIAVPGTCRACGLSISVSARFCRRCGTAQQVA